MRTIKFRGKTKDGEWVYGDLIHYREKEVKILDQNFGCWDILHDGVDVLPETVGQFTGLTDKNGKEIYEGDLVQRQYYPLNGWKFYYYDVSVVLLNTIKGVGLRNISEKRVHSDKFKEQGLDPNNMFNEEYDRAINEKTFFDHIRFMRSERDIEIIGNIHGK